MSDYAPSRLLTAQDLQKSLMNGEQKKLLLDHVMPSVMSAITDLAAAVDEALADNVTVAFQVNLCLEELVTNIIKYGLHESPTHPIHVQIYESEQHLEIYLKDDAPEFNPFIDAPVPDTKLDVEQRPIGGLGIHFVKTLMDQAQAYYDGAGNLVVLLKQL